MSRKKSSPQAFSDAYAQFFASAVGLPASTGRIFAALLASSDPLSQAQLRSELSLSEGSVSEGLRLLLAEGLVERSGEPRARPAFFQLCAGTWADASMRLLDNLKQTHVLAQLTMEHLKEHDIHGRGYAWAASLQAMYDTLLADLPPVVHKALLAADRRWTMQGDPSSAD
ncbi:MAG: MarR family transcriptional regulator [Actinomycetota bacterium]|nr:MarR family transcriptional regulator [Actinomycetota bacterium]